MRILGIAVGVFGCLMLISSINLVRVGKYNLSNPNEMQQFVGGAAFSVIILAGGLWMASRKNKPANSRK